MASEGDARLPRPRLASNVWQRAPTFTDGRIVPVGERVYRRRQKRADYLLRYQRDFLIAIVEAKRSYKSPGDGLQQGKEYAEILGLKFA